LTAGDMNSHRAMYSLLTGSFPGLTVNTPDIHL
jgi:hypothetical protein